MLDQETKISFVTLTRCICVTLDQKFVGTGNKGLCLDSVVQRNVMLFENVLQSRYAVYFYIRYAETLEKWKKRKPPILALRSSS